MYRFVGLLCSVGLACGGAADSEPQARRGDALSPAPLGIPAPLDEAICEVQVDGVGLIEMETDYLPHVIQCENGGANLEALKAQAIAARSVAYWTLLQEGSICDGQGCQVYSCGNEPNALAYQAVQETAGQYLLYNDNLTYAFYVAGVSGVSGPSCIGAPGGSSTEQWVTYNEGLESTSVEQTALGYVHDPQDPGYGQNRGCMSQWGARCLENELAYDASSILRFFYGADIIVGTARGDCVPDTGETSDSGEGDTSSEAGSEGDTLGDGSGGETSGDETGADGDAEVGTSTASNDGGQAEGDGVAVSCECSARAPTYAGGGLWAMFLLGLRRRKPGQPTGPFRRRRVS